MKSKEYQTIIFNVCKQNSKDVIFVWKKYEPFV